MIHYVYCNPELLLIVQIYCTSVLISFDIFSRSEKATAELHEGATCVQFTRQSLENEKIQVFPSA